MAPLHRLTVQADPHALDALCGLLFEAGVSGLEEQNGCLVVYAEQGSEIEAFAELVETFRSKLPEAERQSVVVAREELALDWQSSWQNALRPERVTDTWVLRPKHQGPAPKGENTLWFEPDQCFGSGEHPTTRLAARFLETQLRPTQSLFDVGTGSAILAMIAAKAGAGRILAVDNDPVSVGAARRNLKLNDLVDSVQVELGSAMSAQERFDWVVANINTPVLLELLSDLKDALAEGGTLLLTGLLVEDEEAITNAARPLGLEIHARQRDEPWALLAFQTDGSALA